MGAEGVLLRIAIGRQGWSSDQLTDEVPLLGFVGARGVSERIADMTTYGTAVVEERVAGQSLEPLRDGFASPGVTKAVGILEGIA